ncbi:MAG: HsdR family type I site-specific deoxyribonuclease, partial [Candidatus Thermoplasmatota archaeon]|nr:HsdR family type I site-specific deoxyribonuclease [Candidatus Thermoplasmatota archaeon]
IFMVNGIPLIMMEAKKPTAIYDYTEAIKQIQRYNRQAPQIFRYLTFVCATDGIVFKYDWHENYHYWKNPDVFDPVEGAVKGLFTKEQFLDIVNNFIVFEKQREEIKKKIARYQQVSAANKIINRVLKGEPKTGLIWHTQGSGKTLTMLFAAWKLKKISELKNPTIIVVVDRVELENQLSGVFKNVELPYTAKAESIKDLKRKMAKDSREVIVTTVHKFEGIEKVLNIRENIVVFVDEAHRTQYGLLAASMRKALPNALIFGFTGTPIDKGLTGRSTFRTFCPSDEKYLDKYSIKQSIMDGSTVPIYYLPRLVSYHVDKNLLDREFLRITSDLTEEEQERVIGKSVKLKEVLKSKDRIENAAKDVAEHFKAYVEPLGFKAQLVAVDREACALYKEELDKHLPSEWSRVIYTPAQNDTDLLRKYHLQKDEQLRIARVDFQKPGNPRIIIVTDMLLTGFDAPIEQVMYLDKPLRDHKLLQAIARTNRPYPEKEGGIIVDYIGIFDNLMKALNFEDEDIEEVAFNFDELKKRFKNTLSELIQLFKDIKKDNTRSSLLQAIKVLEDEKNLTVFKEKLTVLKRLFETVSPDPFLLEFKNDYRWIIEINEAYNKFIRREEKPLYEYEDKTKTLIRESVEVYRVGEIPVLKIDSTYLKKLEGLGYSEEEQIMEMRQAISYHLRINFEKNPVYETLSQKLEHILKEKDGRILLKSLKEIVKEINEIEEKAKKLDVSKEEYALLEVLKKHIPGIDEKDGARFIKSLLGGIKPEFFPGWQEKKDVVLGPHGVEEKIFHRCFDEFSGKIKVKQLRAMAEQMIEYLKRFEA